MGEAEELAAVLSRLEPVRDRVVMLGCGEGEIRALAAAVGGTLPRVYEELLKRVGLVQDLFHGTARTVGGMRRTAEEGIYAGYIPFADEEEDMLLLRRDAEDGRVYRLPVDEEAVVEEGTLLEFVARSVEKALGRDERSANAGKEWAVQFAVNAMDERQLLEVLRGTVGLKRGWWGWKSAGTSPAGVVSASMKLKGEAGERELKRQEYAGWETPIFYLNWAEGVAEASRGSVIGRIDAALIAAGLDYVLVDYGLLEKD